MLAPSPQREPHWRAMSAEIEVYDPPPVVLRDGYRFDRYARADYLNYLAAGYGRIAAAKRVNISPRQIRKYIAADPEFAEQVRDAEGSADDEVMNSLYAKAIGHDAVDRDGTVYHVPGSVEAQKFWLANRRTAEWNVGVAKGNVAITAGGDEVDVETLDEMAATAKAIIGALIDKAKAVEEAAKEALEMDTIDAESEEVTSSIPPVPGHVSDPWEGDV